MLFQTGNHRFSLGISVILLYQANVQLSCHNNIMVVYLYVIFMKEINNNDYYYY